MTFSELKKAIEEKFTEIEQEIEEHPTPNIGAQETNPQYLYEYGMKVGEKDALADVLSKWPSRGGNTVPIKPSDNTNYNHT